jgi:hypothetical protein
MFVVEYCPVQKAFHIEPLEEMLENNNKIILNNIKGAYYLPIALAKTSAAASEICNKYKKIIRGDK